MRKILLASTAIVALGVSAASADITLSGSAKWTYTSWSLTGNNNDNTNFTHNSDLTIASSFASDNGLTYGTSHGIDEGGTSDSQKMFVSGSFGEIRFGGATAGDAFDTSANVAEGEANKSGATFAGNSAAAMANDKAVSYFTPSVNGFAAGVATGDAGDTSTADITEMGASYSMDVSGASVKLSYASSDKAASASGANDGISATSLGATITYGDLTLTLASNSKKHDNGSYDYDGTGIGVAYVLQDGLTLKAHNVTADDSKAAGYDASETAVSLTYTVAPGLTANVAYTDYEFDADGSSKKSGSSTTAYLKVAF